MYTCRKYRIKGIVQGVGFRPFIYNTAKKLALSGWVLNDNNGILFEACGPAAVIDSFIAQIQTTPPARADVQSITLVSERECTSASGEFVIKHSVRQSPSSTYISPDMALCGDCLEELFDPTNRRYRYPFINCTNCGPRFSIIRSTPYDRRTTTMHSFTMCAQCQSEYNHPQNRRFHAQPNACSDCGPSLRLLDPAGKETGRKGAIEDAAALLQSGKIIAVKGLTGYHLMVDPRNDDAVKELRRRKNRPAKPLALMSATVEQVGRYVEVSKEAAPLFTGPERPIVILPRKNTNHLSGYIAPGECTLGFMTAYTPLHHLLLHAFAFDCLVATSANTSSEPVVYRDEDALTKLGSIADALLVHNREIHTGVDDSVVRLVDTGAGPGPAFIRRARGYVPSVVTSKHFNGANHEPVIALGPELKNTVCITGEDGFILSGHCGDLKNPAALDSFESTAGHMKQVFEIQPAVAACDLHPGFLNTRYGDENYSKIFKVQHHHAHLAACMAENEIDQLTLGVIFDGFGWGNDGTAWGGEFLLGDYLDFRRVGHMKPIPLPGGDKAVLEPWRIALGMLLQVFGSSATKLNMPFMATRSEMEVQTIARMLDQELNTLWTSSVGRLFDCVSALLNICTMISYEGQAAIRLEQAIERPGQLGHENGIGTGRTGFSFAYQKQNDILIADAEPLIRKIIECLLSNESTARISRNFHIAVVDMIREMCRRIRNQHGVEAVALSGGVFQNVFLLQNASRSLRADGFQVFTHNKVPCNDGGISLGQAAVAAAKLRRR